MATCVAIGKDGAPVILIEMPPSPAALRAIERNARDAIDQLCGPFGRVFPVHDIRWRAGADQRGKD